MLYSAELSESSGQRLIPDGGVMLSVTSGISEENLQKVYTDPFILRIGQDGRPVAPVRHPLAEYVSAWADGVFVGAFLAIHTTRFEIEVHALLLRNAVRYSRELGLRFIAFCFDNYPILRVTAHITDNLRSVQNYCRNIGFKRDGFRRDACEIRGEKYGICTMGITRTEWEVIWVS